MSMQIRSIVLYNTVGDIRKLTFKLGEVNIITGKSSTGKSALIDIVEYCLGRSSFRIPEGPIRDSVTWYGVLYQINDSQVFIAKPSPDRGFTSQSKVYFEVATEITLPPLSRLIPNSNDSAVTEHLSRMTGISPNLHVPEQGESREPLEATIRHASFYLFQKQGTIANDALLFHRQSEQQMEQTIKDTLPYFLGAVQEDRLKLIYEARVARRELKLAQRKLSDAEAIISEGTSQARSLLIEAQQAGLITENADNYSNEQIVGLLQSAMDWQPTISPPIANDRLPQLQREVTNLREQFRRKHNQIRETEIFAQEAEGYSTEAREQELRLESINMFSIRDVDNTSCPLCTSTLSQPIPTVSSIRSSLEDLQSDLRSVRRERPRLRAYIQTLTEEREAIRQQIEQTELSISSLLEEQGVAQRLRDDNSRISRVAGRISFYLENMRKSDELSDLRREVDQARSQVVAYDEQLDVETVEDIKTSILSVISAQMTVWAKQLKLEHSAYPYRLDLNRLTVVADRPGRPISMAQGSMGGGENWLGCHLIVHLALHSYFSQQNRPVPSFLILDQPTQVYFPSERYEKMEGDTAELTDEDRVSVKRVFDLLFDVCRILFPNFQIIVLDHANLDTAEFQQALVEEPWRGGRALIPHSWLTH